MNKKNTLVGYFGKVGSNVNGLLARLAVFCILGILSLGQQAAAQTGANSGNSGADAIIDELSGFAPMAAIVVAAAVLIVVIPWGARIAMKAFKAIMG